MRKCACDDFNDNINRLLMAGYLYAHGIEYTGVLMRYCPWCGTLLDGVTIEEFVRSKAGEQRK